MGFRGNARNLDLNRDFAKCDSKNAQTFNQIFSAWDPDIYLETHVSNGANYPYTMTYLSTQADKLGKPLSDFMRAELNPALFKGMADLGDEMIPYVNIHGDSPDSGFCCVLTTVPAIQLDMPPFTIALVCLQKLICLSPFDQTCAVNRTFSTRVSR